MDETLDDGEGVGGSGTTNRWAVTAGPEFPTVNLGATFGPSAAGPEYNFFNDSRTYSAEATGIVVTP
jgi:hypothetical protein